MAVYSVTCIFAFISLYSVVVTSEENIPIIAWSNSKSLSDVALFAQQTLYATINSIVYKNEKIYIFSQDKISFDDLAKFGGLYGSEGALKNIKKYVSTSESSAILSVPYQPDFVNLLVSELFFLYDKGRAQYFSAEDIMSNDAEFVNSDCKICVISLPEAPSLGVSDRASCLAENDKLIGSVIAKDVVQRGKYIAMVTAKYSQMHTKEQSTLKRAARQESSDSSENCSAPIRYCLNNSIVESDVPNTTYSCYFYMRLHNIVITNGTWNATVDGNTTRDPATPTCDVESLMFDNDTHVYRTITVNYTDVNTTSDNSIVDLISIKYRLPLNTSKLILPKGFWTIELQLFELDTYFRNLSNQILKYKEEGLPPYPLTIPNGTSFHCSSATYCVENEDDRSQCNRKPEDNYPRVIITRLQAELFDNGVKRDFDIAYDCESYFTSTTWMGVLALSILLPILIIGIFLVMQTQTMDRFDDPREPAIVMTVTD